MSRRTIAERFWSKVAEADAEACWLWTASLNQAGYGQFNLGGQPRKAHRVAYELLRTEIPEGLQLDHLCRVRRCVNPWHLEPVTNAVNMARGEFRAHRRPARTHCPQGHDYTPENILRDKDGYRMCRECSRVRCLRYYYSRRDRAAVPAEDVA